MASAVTAPWICLLPQRRQHSSPRTEHQGQLIPAEANSFRATTLEGLTPWPGVPRFDNKPALPAGKLLSVGGKKCRAPTLIKAKKN